jgi:hypothetical protein
VLKFLCFNDPFYKWPVDNANDRDARITQVHLWLRTGKLKAYGRLYQPGELTIDLSRAFQPIEPELWQTNHWQGTGDTLYDSSNLQFRDVFVDKREVVELAESPPKDQANTALASPRGRRPQHDREQFWRTVATAITKLPKQAAFVAEIQEAYVCLQAPNLEPPGETFIKERYAELKSAIADLQRLRRGRKGPGI